MEHLFDPPKPGTIGDINLDGITTGRISSKVTPRILYPDKNIEELLNQIILTQGELLARVNVLIKYYERKEGIALNDKPNTAGQTTLDKEDRRESL